MLRLKQHISEKSRTTQSQVITEEEAFDQVLRYIHDGVIPIIIARSIVFQFGLLKIPFRGKLAITDIKMLKRNFERQSEVTCLFFFYQLENNFQID